MKTALVTGSAGFVGRHLVPRLEAEGYSVLGLDRKEIPLKCWLDPGDKRFDLIVHLAANIVSVDKRMNQGVEAFQDIESDLAMARFVERTKPGCYIYPSSCAVDNPDDPYGFVKQAGERFAMELHRKGIRTVILRPFSGYGPDQSLEYPFPAILKRAMERQDPLEVWGSGKQIRDFIWIDDLVDAFIWAIDGALAGEPIEIGTGMGTTLIHLAKMIATEVGYQPDIRAVEDKPESSRLRIAGRGGLHRLYSTPLEEGIRKSLEWNRTHGKIKTAS